MSDSLMDDISLVLAARGVFSGATLHPRDGVVRFRAADGAAVILPISQLEFEARVERRRLALEAETYAREQLEREEWTR